jgi:ABC-type Na+ efflux pump permease subunit
VARKDVRAIAANMQVWLPMAIVPVVLGVVLPVAAVTALGSARVDGKEAQDLLAFLERLPPSALRDTLEGLPTLQHRLAYVAANYFLAPLFLLVPLMTSSVISADSFAGEKERGTLEALLFTPVDVPTIFAGKVLAALLPSLAVSWGTFALCVVGVNAAGWRLFHGLFFPDLGWLPLVLLVIPALSLLAILFNVFISARVATFQAAYQLGGLVILPALALLGGQASGLLILDAWTITAVGVVLVAVDLLLLRVVARRLDRNQLFESQVR